MARLCHKSDLNLGENDTLAYFSRQILKVALRETFRVLCLRFFAKNTILIWHKSQMSNKTFD